LSVSFGTLGSERIKTLSKHVGEIGTRGGGFTPRPSQGPDGSPAFEYCADGGGGKRSSEVEDGPPMKTGARAM